MSGGSWDYVYYKIQDAVDGLVNDPTPLRRALGRKLEPFVKALHDIEWVDSNDYGKGQDEEAIRAALGENAEAMILAEAIKKAESVAAEFEMLIKAARAKER
jgi:hypothetical protein